MSEDQNTSSAMTSKSTAGATTGATTGGAGRADDRSMGELVAQISQESSQLVRDEMRLAKAELAEKGKQAGIGVGAFGAAGVLALFGLGVLITTAILALSLVLAPWLAALIVGVVVLVIAGVAALIGRNKVQAAAPPTPTRTIESVKTDVQEIKESARHDQ